MNEWISICVSSSDLEKWDVIGQMFPVDLCNYACAIWPRTIKFGQGHIPSVQPHSFSLGGSPASLDFFRTGVPTPVPFDLDNPIQHGDKWGRGLFFSRDQLHPHHKKQGHGVPQFF